jgi:shikimate kinase
MKIVLIGYMGSGKSAVARALSAKLKLNLIDLDSYIEAQEGLSISQLFAEKGALYFRNKERFYLQQLLDSEASMLVSLGGGTPCFSGNMDLIQNSATSIYLRTSVATLCMRLLPEKSKRPLIAEIADEHLQEFIAKHLFERSAFYERASHTVTTNDVTIAQLVDEISELLRKS